MSNHGPIPTNTRIKIAALMAMFPDAAFELASQIERVRVTRSDASSTDALADTGRESGHSSPVTGTGKASEPEMYPSNDRYLHRGEDIGGTPGQLYKRLNLSRECRRRLRQQERAQAS